MGLCRSPAARRCPTEKGWCPGRRIRIGADGIWFLEGSPNGEDRNISG
jgi:hypothetical protein